MAKTTCAYCKSHKCEITVKQMRLHKCLSRGCMHLVPYENHPFFIERARRKAESAERKKRLNGTATDIESLA